jgi:cysteinyl-tRNA synthetase
MSNLYLTNSLTRKKEKFVAINPPKVGMYTCGPTVYDYAHIGNFRTYTIADILLRTLEYSGLKVKYVMNLTDVGHLTGDNVGDADFGEDRMEKAAKSEGKTAWDIAKFYSKIFLGDIVDLNLKTPNVLPAATEHIKEQIELVKTLEEKKFTYKTSDGMYFDTKGYEAKTGKEYGKLSTLDKIREGARVELNPEKKDARDFALWKFSEKPGERQMEWKSPWGLGFPGWHIECSAMSMKYLGSSFDIHVGGEDLRGTHHPNEIAQSEAATGKQFVTYWLHVTFLQVEGKRMSKSKGNVYTVADIKEKKINPLSLRYLYLTAHYKDSLNFTWDALESAENALKKLETHVRSLRGRSGRTVLSEEKNQKTQKFSTEFKKAVNDDLNTPQALAVLWTAVKSNIPSEDKYDLLISFDEILGLGLNRIKAKKSKNIETKSGLTIITPTQLSGPTIDRIEKRETLRDKGKYDEADKMRIKIKVKDKISIKDTAQGTVVEPEE